MLLACCENRRYFKLIYSSHSSHTFRVQMAIQTRIVGPVKLPFTHWAYLVERDEPKCENNGKFFFIVEQCFCTCVRPAQWCQIWWKKVLSLFLDIFFFMTRLHLQSNVFAELLYIGRIKGSITISKLTSPVNNGVLPEFLYDHSLHVVYQSLS